jgi:hypothetical protein
MSDCGLKKQVNRQSEISNSDRRELMKKINAILSSLVTMAMVASVFAQTGSNAKLVTGASSAVAATASGETLIKNATIMTASHGTINNGSILIRNGKIAEIGSNLKPRDPNARIIDATGKYVTPGIIDCHSHTGVDGNVNEGSLSVTSMVRIRDVIDPYSPSIYRGLAGGTTTSNVLHGSANSIGGQNAVVKWKVGKPVDEWLVTDAPPGIKFALGENPKREPKAIEQSGIANHNSAPLSRYSHGR